MVLCWDTKRTQLYIIDQNMLVENNKDKYTFLFDSLGYFKFIHTNRRVHISDTKQH